MLFTKDLVSIVLAKDILSIQDEGEYIGFKEANVDYGLAECELISKVDFVFVHGDNWAIKNKCYINDIYNEFWWDRIEKQYFADIPNKNKSFYANSRMEARINAYNWILQNKIIKEG